MSLKAFHLIFITASSALAFGCGVWGLKDYFSPDGGLGSRFRPGLARRRRRPNPLRALLPKEAQEGELSMSPRQAHFGFGFGLLRPSDFGFGLPRSPASPCLPPAPLRACAACYGQSDSPMAEGMNWGIFSLLAMIVVVLGGVAAFFVYLASDRPHASRSPAPGQGLASPNFPASPRSPGLAGALALPHRPNRCKPPSHDHMMEKLLGLPPLASEHGQHVDNLIIYIHWLMIVLFVGWLVYFRLRARPLPPRAQSQGGLCRRQEPRFQLLEVRGGGGRRRTAGRPRGAALGQGGG